MFNPSNGAAAQSDNTINKVLKYIDEGRLDYPGRKRLSPGSHSTKMDRPDGLKIINIFSYQDSSPTMLLRELDKIKRERRVGNDGAMNELGVIDTNPRSAQSTNPVNRLQDWQNYAEGAKLIVAAWGNCAPRAFINEKKHEVAEWLNDNYLEKLGYFALTAAPRCHPTHPRGWTGNMVLKRGQRLPTDVRDGQCVCE